MIGSVLFMGIICWALYDHITTKDNNSEGRSDFGSEFDDD